MILTGLHIDHNKHCTLEFSSYVQIHEEHDNSMTSRTSGAIALRPTGNTQGTHYFLNINSGRRVARNHWMVLTMPNDIIQAVHRLAAANKKHKGIVFTDKYGNVINDNSPKESDNTEITGVRTGVGNTNNAEDNINNAEDNTYTERNINTGNTETNNTQEYTGNTETNNTQEYEQETYNEESEVHETHGTQEYEETYDEEPTIHDEQIVNEMNATNLRHDPETENDVTNLRHDLETENREEHTENIHEEEHTENIQGTQAGNTTTYGYNLWPRPTKVMID